MTALDLQRYLQRTVNEQRNAIVRNPRLLEPGGGLLSPREFEAFLRGDLRAVNLGKAMQARVRDIVNEGPHSQLIEGLRNRPNTPDFILKGRFEGLNLELTTGTRKAVRDHLRRPYVRGHGIVTYKPFTRQEIDEIVEQTLRAQQSAP